MLYAVQWMRSLIFNIQMYLAGLVIGILFLPWALISLRGGENSLPDLLSMGVLDCWLDDQSED